MILELSRYGARTATGSNVVSDLARNSRAYLRVQTSYKSLVAIDIGEKLRDRALISASYPVGWTNFLI